MQAKVKLKPNHEKHHNKIQILQLTDSHTCTWMQRNLQTIIKKPKHKQVKPKHSDAAGTEVTILHAQ